MWKEVMVVVVSCCGDGFHQQGLRNILGKVDGANCRNILVGKLWVFQKVQTVMKVIIQQDSVPKHTTEATLRWFEENLLKVLE